MGRHRDACHPGPHLGPQLSLWTMTKSGITGMIPLSHKSHKHLHKISLWSWKKKTTGILLDQSSPVSVELSGELKIRLSGLGVGAGWLVYAPGSRRWRHRDCVSLISFLRQAPVSKQEPPTIHLCVCPASHGVDVKGKQKSRVLHIKLGTQWDFSTFTEI